MRQSLRSGTGHKRHVGKCFPAISTWPNDARETVTAVVIPSVRKAHLRHQPAQTFSDLPKLHHNCTPIEHYEARKGRLVRSNVVHDSKTLVVIANVCAFSWAACKNHRCNDYRRRNSRLDVQTCLPCGSDSQPLAHACGIALPDSSAVAPVRHSDGIQGSSGRYRG